jgi:exopolysaccharide biosynthesis polyprenyl glycosylphosphotransferase
VTLALVEGAALFGAAAATIFAWGHPPLVNWLDVLAVLGQAAALSLCWVVTFYYNDLYDFSVVRSLSDFGSRLLRSFGVAMILLAGFFMVVPEPRIPGGPFLSSILMIIGLVLPLRVISYCVLRRRAFADRVLIVGTGTLAQTLIEEIDARPHLGYEIVGVVDNESAPKNPRLRYPLLGPLEHLAKIAEEVRAHRIIVAMSERRGRMPMDQLLEAEAHGILVEDGLQTYEHFTKKLAIEALRPSLLVFSAGFRRNRLQSALRRLINLGIAATGLVLMAPLMALIALAIKLDSQGPVLFVQDRVGLLGRHFRLLKFRTMVPFEGITSEWAQDNEDRITRAGRWLRRYRLDELPQFVNILRGDMDLVGPRPHPVSNFALFADRIPYYVLRTSVHPGVTGWAQIRYGYANDLDEETEKMRYDLYYIKHRSFWFDLRILLDTVKIVLFSRGRQTADADPREALADGAPTSTLGRRV